MVGGKRGRESSRSFLLSGRVISSLSLSFSLSPFPRPWLIVPTVKTVFAPIRFQPLVHSHHRDGLQEEYRICHRVLHQRLFPRVPRQRAAQDVQNVGVPRNDGTGKT